MVVRRGIESKEPVRVIKESVPKITVATGKVKPRIFELFTGILLLGRAIYH